MLHKRIGSTGIVENRPQEIVEQFRFRPIVPFNQVTAQNTWYPMAYVSDAEVAFVTLMDTRVGGANKEVRFTVDGVVLVGAVLPDALNPVYYVYLDDDSDTLVFDTNWQLAGNGIAFPGHSFLVEARQTTAAGVNLVGAVRVWSL